MGRLVVYASSKQGKNCYGVCEQIKKSRPVGNPYEKGYVYCSRCIAWMMKDTMKANGRCPCCNFRPRYKTKGEPRK